MAVHVVVVVVLALAAATVAARQYHIPAHGQEVFKLGVAGRTRPDDPILVRAETVGAAEEGSGTLADDEEPRGRSTHNDRYRFRSHGYKSVFFGAAYMDQMNHWELRIDTSANASKTLCIGEKDVRGGGDTVSLAAFTNSDTDISVRLEAAARRDFYLELNRQVVTSVSPGNPGVFQFNTAELSYNSEQDETYMLTVKADGGGGQCMFVTVNEPGCPWKDQVETVTSSKMWARMLSVGYFPIRAADFPNSFVVTIVPLEDSTDCHSPVAGGSRQPAAAGDTRINVVVEKTLNSYTIPVVSSVVSIMAASVIFFLLWLLCWKRSKGEENGQGIEDIELADLSAYDEERNRKNEYRVDLCREMEDRQHLNSKIKDARRRLLVPRMTVAHMIRTIRENVWHRRQRSKVFLYLLPILSIVYLIPSSQMVWMEKTLADISGNMEQCYLNYGCSRPWGLFNDFNHIVSNFGYVWYGLVFILLVRVKSHYLPEENRTDTDHLGKKGLPQQHSIFYAMGIALVMQGIFSSNFHVCPSNTSLQFDTTMMYIMLALGFVKIYQSRHPDTATNAYRCMYALSVALVMEALSLYIYGTVLRILFNLVFVLLHLILVAYVCLDVYYYGALKTHWTMVPLFCWHGATNCCHIMYKKRFALCVGFATVNIGLLIGTLLLSMEGGKSLSTPLLLIFGVNMALYLSYYMFRKIVEICRSGSQQGALQCCMSLLSFLFFLFALVLGGVAAMFYVNKHQSRNLTPPESRDRNEACNFMDFFDNHDMWHFFSATALFSAFIFLLTIDDDLLSTARRDIDVF